MIVAIFSAFQSSANSWVENINYKFPLFFSRCPSFFFKNSFFKNFPPFFSSLRFSYCNVIYSKKKKKKRTNDHLKLLLAKRKAKFFTSFGKMIFLFAKFSSRRVFQRRCWFHVNSGCYCCCCCCLNVVRLFRFVKNKGLSNTTTHHPPTPTHLAYGNKREIGPLFWCILSRKTRRCIATKGQFNKQVVTFFFPSSLCFFFGSFRYFCNNNNN